MTDNELDRKETRKPVLPELERVLARYVIDMSKASQPVTRDSLIIQSKIQCRRYNIDVPDDFQFSDG